MWAEGGICVRKVSVDPVVTVVDQEICIPRDQPPPPVPIPPLPIP
jgi:hypothetical protein